MSDESNEEGDDPQVPVWPRESQPDFSIIISPDEPFRIMREWERNKRYDERSERAAIKRLQDLIKLKAKTKEFKELSRALGTEIAAKMLIEWASKSGISMDLVMTVIKNLFS